MKTRMWRCMVAVFSLAIVGFLALCPRSSFGDQLGNQNSNATAFAQGQAAGFSAGSQEAQQAGVSEVQATAPPPTPSGGNSSGC